jgi:hypothetical protein
MLSPETWKWLETYREFITNGLDLLSFVLITPELFRFVGPTIGKLPLRLFRFGVTIVAVWLVASALQLLGLPPPGRDAVVVPAIAAVAFAIIIEFLRALASPVEPAVARTGDWMVRNAFMLGVVMFFISRAIAFAIAAHQVLAPG